MEEEEEEDGAVQPTHPRDEEIAREHWGEVKSLPRSLQSPTHDRGEQACDVAGDETFKSRSEQRKHTRNCRKSS